MATESVLHDAVIYLGAAVIAVPLSKFLGLGAVLGYLLAGVAIGPWGLNLIGDAQSILHFSEFGVVLLLFLIGLELNPSRLWALRHAIFGLGGLQLLLTAGVLSAVGAFFLEDYKTLFVVATALALSSTAMAMQLIDEKNLSQLSAGQSGFAVLLFQDLAVIPLLALMPIFAPNVATAAHDNPAQFGQSVAVIVAILIGGRYLARHIFRLIAKTKLRELFTAFALLLVIGIALLMQAVGLSMALGTFLAGVVLADSEYRTQLETEIEPFKGLLMGLFFIAVGMSTNIGLVAAEPALILTLLVGILTLKFAVLFAIGRLFHLSTNQSLMFAALVSQVGEFAFVVFGLAAQLRLVDSSISDPLFVVVGLSMLTTPLLLIVVERLIARRLADVEPEAVIQQTPDPILVVGVGRMGQVISRTLTANGFAPTVIDNDPDQVALSRRFAHRAYYGDARRLDLLESAGLANARLLIVACDDPDACLRIVDVVQENYPDTPIIARARNRTHAYALFERGIRDVERETFFSALAMAERVLAQLGYATTDARDAVEFFRQHDEEMLERLFELRDEPDQLRQSVIQARKDYEQLMAEEIHKRQEAQ